MGSFFPLLPPFSQQGEKAGCHPVPLWVAYLGGVLNSPPKKEKTTN